MSLDEGLSRFIGRLYEAVYEPVAWRSTMHELMKRTGSRLLFVCHADVRHREYSRTDFYGPDTSAFARGTDEYGEEMYRADPSLLWASAHPDAGVCDTSRLMSNEDFRKRISARELSPRMEPFCIVQLPVKHGYWLSRYRFRSWKR